MNEGTQPEKQAWEVTTPDLEIHTDFQYDSRRVGEDFWSPSQFVDGYLLNEVEAIHAMNILNANDYFKYVTWGNRDVEHRIRPADKVFVNVYEVTRDYGGPEEGGWWYDAKHILESHPTTADECLSLRFKLQQEFGPGDKELYPIGAKQYRVDIEPHEGASTPRPRYE